MSRLVMKFGGTSVADLERIARVARLVAVVPEVAPVHPVVAVVAPAVVPVAVPAVVRVVAVAPAVLRNGGARSVVAIAPSSNRLRSGSRLPMHPFLKARSSSRAAARSRSTRPS